MSEPRLMPTDIAERMIVLVRREALWRGVVIGAAGTLAAVVAVYLIL
jgi:hypothetical protein